MAKKVILISVLVVAILAGGLVILSQMQVRRAEQQRQNEIQRQIVPLLQEKRALLDENAQLERQYEGKMQTTATVQILFSDLSETLYLEVFPMMLQSGYKGVMALSETQYPGAPGAITVRQFEEMVRDGWTYCLQWDGEAVVWDAFQEVQWKMPESTLDMPDTVYLEAGKYSSEMNRTLIQQGIRMVIHHGEDGQILDIDGEEESLWRIGAVRWEPDTARTNLSTCIGRRGNLVYDVKFDENYSSYDIFGFQDLLYAISTYQETNAVSVTTFAELKKLYTQETDNKRWLKVETINAEIAENTERLSQLNRQIQAITTGVPLEEITENELDTETLENNILNLRNAMDRFDREHPYQMVGSATIELVFPRLDVSLYTEVLPQLNAQDIPAILVLSESQMPDTEGCLTWEQVKAMKSAGWELAIGYTGGNLAEQVETYRKLFSDMELDMPTTLYTQSGLYTDELQGTALVYGMRTILHHGETGLTLADYPDNPDFWRAGCVVWNPESAGAVLDPVVENASNLAIELSYTDVDHPYLSSGLSKMLEETRDSVKLGRLRFMTFPDALTMQLESAEARERVNREREEGLAEYQQQIDALQNRMTQQ